MTLNKLKSIISECCNDVLFTYNGFESGITSDVDNYTPTFKVWHGETVKEYSNIDNVFHDKIFSGKSLTDLIDLVEFTFA